MRALAELARRMLNCRGEGENVNANRFVKSAAAWLNAWFAVALILAVGCGGTVGTMGAAGRGGATGTAGTGGDAGQGDATGTDAGGGDGPACPSFIPPGATCSGGIDCPGVAGPCDCIAGRWQCRYSTCFTDAFVMSGTWCPYIEVPAGCACSVVYSPQQGNSYCNCMVTDAGAAGG